VKESFQPSQKLIDNRRLRKEYRSTGELVQPYGHGMSKNPHSFGGAAGKLSLTEQGELQLDSPLYFDAAQLRSNSFQSDKPDG